MLPEIHKFEVAPPDTYKKTTSYVLKGNQCQGGVCTGKAVGLKSN